MRTSTLSRLARAVLGPEVDPALRPLLVVSLVSALAFAAFFSFAGIWAVQALHAPGSDVGIMFALAAIAGTATAFAGGQISDRVGRKPVIVASLAGEPLAVLGLLLVHDIAAGIALVVIAAGFGIPSLSASKALVADLVPPARVDEAYAALRVATNLGVALGPPLASLLVVAGGWRTLLIGAVLLGLLSAWVAVRLLPASTGRATDEDAPQAGLRMILRDRPFLVLLGSTILGFVVYFAYESVLPVVAVKSYHLRPAAWGLLVAINPAVVTLLQVRLTHAVENIGDTPKLGAAMLLMGLPFLIFLVRADLVAIVVVIVVFVIGEMLWLPTSQALAVRLAPSNARGAYMGALSASTWIGWTLGPLLGFQVRSAFGTEPMWVVYVAAALVGCIAGVAAASAAEGVAGRRVFAGNPRPVARSRQKAIERSRVSTR